MALREEKVVLLIADISGYTDFMLANEKSLEHSHLIISELIETILGEVELPLTLAKLEGDAVFLYAVKDEAFAARADDLGARVLRFFHAFSNKVAELTLSSFCKCGACRNIETLKLKVVVHSGRCAFYQIAGLTELSGVDVIVVHRLLKNSVGSSEYVLITEAAQQDLRLPLTLLSRGEESYDGIGAVPTFVYSPPETPAYVPDPSAPAPSLFLETLRCEIKREYAEVATNPTKGFHFHTGRTLARLLGYSNELLEGIPESSIGRLAGTGNPFALGPLHSGECVVGRREHRVPPRIHRGYPSPRRFGRRRHLQRRHQSRARQEARLPRDPPRVERRRPAADRRHHRAEGRPRVGQARHRSMGGMNRRRSAGSRADRALGRMRLRRDRDPVAGGRLPRRAAGQELGDVRHARRKLPGTKGGLTARRGVMRKRIFMAVAAMLLLQLVTVRADEGTWEALWRFDTHG